MRTFWHYILLFILLASFAFANSFLDPRGGLKTVIEGQLSKALKRQVTIDSMSGNIYQRIVLNGVTISSSGNIVATAESINLHYSLKNMMLSGFDVLSHVYLIEINRPVVNLVRDRSGGWNLWGALQEQSAATQPLRADTVVKIINGQGSYTDYLGFAPMPLPKKFKTDVKALQATIKIKNELISFGLTSNVQAGSLFVSGKVDLLTQKHSLKARVTRQQLRPWAEYLTASTLVDLKGLIELAANYQGYSFDPKDMRKTIYVQSKTNGSITTNITVSGPVSNLTIAARLTEGVVTAQATLRGPLFTLKFVNQKYSLRLPDPSLHRQYETILPVDLSGQISGNLEKMPHSLVIIAYAHADKGLLYGERIREAKASIMMRNSELCIDDLQVSMPQSLVKADVRYDVLKNEARVHVAAPSFVSLQDLTVVQRLLPESAGQISLEGFLWTNTRQVSLNAAVGLRGFSYGDILIDRVQAQVNVSNNAVNIPQYLVAMDSQYFSGSGYFYPHDQFLSLRTEQADIQKIVRLVQRTQAKIKEVKQSAQILLQPTQTIVVLPERLPATNILYAEDQSESRLAAYKEYSLFAKGVVGDTLPIKGKLVGNIEYRYTNNQLALNAQVSIQKGNFFDYRFDEWRWQMINTGNQTIVKTTIDNLKYAQASFGRIYAQGKLISTNIVIETLDLARKDIVAKHCLSGVVPLNAWWDKTASRMISLELDLPAEYLSVVPAYAPQIIEAQAKGHVYASFGGSLDAMTATSVNIRIQDCSLKIDSPYISELKIPAFIVVGNQEKLEMQQVRLRLGSGAEISPELVVRGSIGLSPFNVMQPDMQTASLDLLLADIDDTLSFKRLYVGAISLSNVSLVGTYVVPLSLERKKQQEKRILAHAEEGPLVRGSLTLSDGTLFIGRAVAQAEKTILPELLFDAQVVIKQDVNVQTSDSVLADDQRTVVDWLTNIRVTLRDDNAPVLLKGSLNNPRIKGRVYLAEGYVGFLSRKFTLLDRRDQEQYLLVGEKRPEDNFAEFREDADSFLPRFHLVAQTTVYEEAQVSTNAEVSGNVVQPKALKEKDYLVFVDGPITDISSLSFAQYKKTNGRYNLVGEPYIMIDSSGKRIDPVRFQELAFDISPTVFKSTIQAMRNNAAVDTTGLTRETARDVTQTEVNLLMRQLLRPVEKKVAKSVSLYDIRFKRDIGLDAVNALQLNDTQLSAERAIEIENWMGLQLVGDLWNERLFLTLDTSVDQQVRSKQLQLQLQAWRLTWKILQDQVFDEVSLNFGAERDAVLLDAGYVPVMSLEAVNVF